MSFSQNYKISTENISLPHLYPSFSGKHATDSLNSDKFGFFVRKVNNDHMYTSARSHLQWQKIRFLITVINVLNYTKTEGRWNVNRKGHVDWNQPVKAKLSRKVLFFKHEILFRSSIYFYIFKTVVMINLFNENFHQENVRKGS